MSSIFSSKSGNLALVHAKNSSDLVEEELESPLTQSLYVPIISHIRPPFSSFLRMAFLSYCSSAHTTHPSA